MLEQSTSDSGSSPYGGMLPKIGIAVGALYVIVSLWLIFDLHGRVSKLETDQKNNAAETSKRLEAAESRSKANSEALAERVGMTQKELQSKADELQKSQRASEARLAKQQQEQIGAVASEVGNVKTDVGGVKTDVAQTKSELEATKAKLEKTIGDLGVQSGLIARTHDDLEVLKHRGDRNYYEFTLQKGRNPVPVGTISLQLKKTDQKKGRFTLNVMSDDRTIEKKDKNIFEPLQFYSGRDRMLYEVVVNNMDKNQVSGDLATPKAAPQPVTP